MDAEQAGAQPTIIAFIAALMTATQVQRVCAHLGYNIIIIETASELPELGHPHKTAPGEPLFGQEGKLLDIVTKIQPALLIFDLANSLVPWRKWLGLLRSSPATRNLPILCFGPHVDTAAFHTARELKVDKVVARSKFMAQMPQLIGDLAHKPATEDINLSCKDPISKLGMRGLEAFNRGEYFEAHEYLEEAWKHDHSPSRNVYKAVLQVAVAYLQIERQNYSGAIKMFLRSRQWLTPLPDVCRGINIAQLKLDAVEVHRQITDLGPGRIERFDCQRLPSVVYIDQP